MFDREIARHLILDLDNTLYSYERPHVLAQTAMGEFLASVLRLGTAEIADVLNVARQGVKNRLGHTAASHSRLLYVQEMYRQLGLRVEPRVILQAEQTYWSEFLGAMVPISGLVDFLALARQRGMEISVVTDLTSQIQLRKLIRLGIESWVDSLISSEELGRDKSQSGTFAIAIEMLRVPQDATVWFVGDETKDFPKQDEFQDLGLRINPRFFLRGQRGSDHFECFKDFSELARRLDSVD